jgi:hypothetical protein
MKKPITYKTKAIRKKEALGASAVTPENPLRTGDRVVADNGSKGVVTEIKLNHRLYGATPAADYAKIEWSNCVQPGPSLLHFFINSGLHADTKDERNVESYPRGYRQISRLIEVHPISKEHPLVVGDRVRIVESGLESVVTRSYPRQSHKRPLGTVHLRGEGFVHDAHTGKAMTGDVSFASEVERIAHAK